jgi:hypothetical protein
MTPREALLHRIPYHGILAATTGLHKGATFIVYSGYLAGGIVAAEPRRD